VISLDWKSKTFVRKAAMFAAAVPLAFLAACGSSSGGGTTTTTAGSGGGSASKTSGSGGGSTGLSAAQAATTAAEQPAKTLGITTPLKSATAKGKTFIFLSCEIPQCATISQGVKAATAAIGWNFRQINYQQANPATLITAMKQALAFHPAAVGFSGLPEVVWQSEVAAYKAAGVAIVPFAVAPVTVSGPVITDINGAADSIRYGDMLANWVIADSKGKAHTLFVNTPTLTILNYVFQGFSATMKKNCPSCSTTVLNQTIADAVGGQLTQATVSALQRDTSLNYAVVVDGAFFDGLPSALSAAGLSGKVKIAGQAGDPANLAGVNSGTEAAFTGLAATIGGWLMVDAAARHLEGMPIPTDDGGLPTQLFTKGGHFTVSSSYDEPANYVAQFKKLWHVG
jgi:ribose transport system substrate-binding protein